MYDVYILQYGGGHHWDVYRWIFCCWWLVWSLFELLGRSSQDCEDRKPCAKLGKMSFRGEKGYCFGSSHFKKGIDIDLSKVEVIERLPPPISVKGVRSFFGHAGFYRRIIKDFWKIAHPLCKLLEKECKFCFDESWLKAFGELKEKLVSAPIIISPD